MAYGVPQVLRRFRVLSERDIAKPRVQEEIPLDTMLAPRVRKEKFGISLKQETIQRVDEIVSAERAKSRNHVIGSFLAFAVELFPVLKPHQKQFEEYARAEGCSYAEAVGQLAIRGLRGLKK